MSPVYDINDEFLLDFEVEGDLPPAALPPADGPLVPQFFSPRTASPWDPRLVLDLAVEVDSLPDILARYGLSEAEFTLLSNAPAFRRELAMAMREQREQGLSFAIKAKVQAESYLQVLDGMVYDDQTPASVRLEAIRSAVRWGRLEPEKDTKSDMNATQVVVNITI